MAKPSDSDKRAAVEAQRAMRENGLRQHGIDGQKAEAIARKEMEQAVRKLQLENEDWKS